MDNGKGSVLGDMERRRTGMGVGRQGVRAGRAWEANKGPAKHPDLLVTPLRSAVLTLVVGVMLLRVELYE